MFNLYRKEEQHDGSHQQTRVPAYWPLTLGAFLSIAPLTGAARQSPRYVFLFIGDGMSYPQFQAAADYLGAIREAGEPDDKILKGSEYLSFMKFPVAGSAATYDSTSFCPDSASTATFHLHRTQDLFRVINMDEGLTREYESIAETLHNGKGWKVGIITSVNLNHARLRPSTPTSPAATIIMK